MYTKCPRCQTVFRLGAAQLRAAAGQVRCGRCQAVFDALEHPATDSPVEPAPTAHRTVAASQAQPALREEARQTIDQPRAEAPPLPGQPDRAGDSEPYSVLDQLDLAPPPENIAEPVAPQKAAPTAEYGAKAEETALAADAAESEASEIAEAGAATAEPSPGQDNEHSPTPSDAADLLLTFETPPHRSLAPTLLWGLGVLIMCGTLAVQYLYFHRDELAPDPDWRPYLEQLCRVAQCQLPLRQDLSLLEFTDRAVQAHPRLAGALLITATLHNSADFPQPYPRVEVTMTDLNQRPIASRLFRPEEYLANHRPGPAFAPGAEAHLVLEVQDPGPNAVNYQFSFR